MLDDMVFSRLASSNVLAQCHASPDSRFILLPVIEKSSHIHGWTVYDTTTGQMLRPDVLTDGEVDGVWDRLHKAREWVVRTYYGGST